MYINAQEVRGLTPLHVAVINRNLELVIILINNGACLFLEDRLKMMAIDYV